MNWIVCVGSATSYKELRAELISCDMLAGFISFSFPKRLGCCEHVRLRSESDVN